MDEDMDMEVDGEDVYSMVFEGPLPLLTPSPTASRASTPFRPPSPQNEPMDTQFRLPSPPRNPSRAPSLPHHASRAPISLRHVSRAPTAPIVDTPRRVASVARTPEGHGSRSPAPSRTAPLPHTPPLNSRVQHQSDDTRSALPNRASRAGESAAEAPQPGPSSLQVQSASANVQTVQVPQAGEYAFCFMIIQYGLHSCSFELVFSGSAQPSPSNLSVCC